MLETTPLRAHLNELSDQMWTVFSIDRETSLDLRRNGESRLKRQFFRPAELASTRNVQADIRNDQIFWLDAKLDGLEKVEREFLAVLEELRLQIKHELRVSLNEIECHYAYYEKGHYYQRHRDTTALNNRRVFSYVLYLNENWQENDGGELVAYRDQEILFRVKPELGRLILFRSDLEHEVRATRRDRFSLTGWFRC